MIRLRCFSSLGFLPILPTMLHKQCFKSFVFFDLETTGLQRPVEITEISLIGVSTDHLESCSTATLPRILDKMTICVRPSKDIEPGAQRLTKLTNDELQDHKGFDKDLANSIKTFLVRQKLPCCLVAHGGDNFDFDILASEFYQVGVELPDSLMVSDSCTAFRAFHNDITLSDKKTSWRDYYVGPYVGGISHSLSSLYKRYTGEDIEGSHTAEADTLALLKLTIAKPEVLPYIVKQAHNLVNKFGTQNAGLSIVKQNTAMTNDNECDQSKAEENQVLEEYFNTLNIIWASCGRLLDNFYCVHVSS